MFMCSKALKGCNSFNPEMDVQASPKWAMSTFKLSRCQDREKCRLPLQIPFFPLKFPFFYIRAHFFQINARILPKITQRQFFF